MISGEWNTRDRRQMFNRKPAANPKERSIRIVSGRRAAGATTPTSVSLTLEEKSALTALAKKRNVSLSHLLRAMAQKALAEDGGESILPTVGIVDGIYPATIHDDVVTLSNLVIALGFVVETLDGYASRNRKLEARAQLKDVLEQLRKIAGRPR